MSPLAHQYVTAANIVCVVELLPLLASIYSHASHQIIKRWCVLPLYSFLTRRRLRSPQLPPYKT